MKSKRIFAYLIDMIILIFILFIIGIFFKNQNVESLHLEAIELHQTFLSKEVGFATYINHYSSIMHDLSKQTFLYTFIGLLIMSVYFVWIPYKWKGQTLGKRAMHLKIHKKGELTIQSLLYRAILINGLGYVTVSLLLLWILPSFSYFFTISSICILQVILVIVSFFMILYNKDGKSLEDLLTDTEVIHVEEVK